MIPQSRLMDTPSPESLLTSGPTDTAAAGEQIETPAATTATGTQPATAPAAVEGQGTEAKPAEGEKAAAGAPEAYEAFTMPEGFALDEQLLGEFTPVLKELNLPQEAAQKVIDFAPKLIDRAVQETTAAVLDNLGMTDRSTWAQDVTTDKEIGGDKLAENLATAQKAMAAFATPELRAMLNKTGLGNHPELIRAFVKVGKAISEDGFVPGGKTTTVSNPATALYDVSKMNP